MPLADVQDAVHEIVRARGAAFDQHSVEKTNGLELGSSGLGLDSIAIAEVLLDCERRFGMSFTDLLDGAPITLGSLIARAARAATK
jgi:acyl carrier protein